MTEKNDLSQEFKTKLLVGIIAGTIVGFRVSAYIDHQNSPRFLSLQSERREQRNALLLFTKQFMNNSSFSTNITIPGSFQSYFETCKRVVSKTNQLQNEAQIIGNQVSVSATTYDLFEMTKCFQQQANELTDSQKILDQIKLRTVVISSLCGALLGLGMHGYNLLKQNRRKNLNAVEPNLT